MVATPCHMKSPDQKDIVKSTVFFTFLTFYFFYIFSCFKIVLEESPKAFFKNYINVGFKLGFKLAFKWVNFFYDYKF